MHTLVHKGGILTIMIFYVRKTMFIAYYYLHKAVLQIVGFYDENEVHNPVPQLQSTLDQI